MTKLNIQTLLNQVRFILTFYIISINTSSSWALIEKTIDWKKTNV